MTARAYGWQFHDSQHLSISADPDGQLRALPAGPEVSPLRSMSKPRPVVLAEGLTPRWAWRALGVGVELLALALVGVSIGCGAVAFWLGRVSRRANERGGR